MKKCQDGVSGTKKNKQNINGRSLIGPAISLKNKLSERYSESKKRIFGGDDDDKSGKNCRRSLS